MGKGVGERREKARMKEKMEREGKKERKVQKI